MSRLMAWTLFLLFAATTHAQQLQLSKGAHICIVGNGFAERMQHFGWFESLVHARFPEHELVFRNLGYSGDEIDGFRNFNSRLRSMDFGSHDQWLAGNAPCPQPTKLSPRDEGKVRENRFELTNTRADVILAFFGYNESWADEAGLDKFRENVTAFIDHTLAQKYNGKSAPQLVLVSPTAMEFVGDPNLPGRADVEAANRRLQLYTTAMGEIAAARKVPFVDLFTNSVQLFSNRTSPLTTNGIHFNDGGDKQIAEALDAALFGKLKQPVDAGRLEALRTAVLDKNFYWYNRYRATDGYSTYGDRAFLKFSEGPGGYGNGLSNYSVVQRELEVLDVLTANRDKVVWSVARGQKAKPDDSNLPEFIPVISNKPGPLEGGKHVFLSGEEAIKQMTVHKNMKVELFADEAMFPELVNPVQMAFDPRGRLWVAVWETYPHWKPTEPMDDKLLILEDTNHDGRADKCITFAGDIHNPTGFEFWGGGVLVAQGPDLLFLKDTDGDDRYDVKERILHGLDTADTHHTANSFVLDPGGALYFQEGTFHHSQIETPWGPTRRVANGAVFRYDPRQRRPDVYVTFGFANPHGHAFDAWGQDIVVDGTGANPFHAPLFSSFLEFPNKHSRPPQVYQQRTRPCPAIEILSSSHFPEENRGNLLVPNVIGFQGILQYKLHDQDSSLGATEVEPIVSSTDPNFRPADVEVAPDGSIYFTDWQNPIIGHMQHNLRDPNRDRTHGRVYRVTYVGRPLVDAPAVAGEPIEKLLKLLEHKDDRLRYRARIELSGRPSNDVIAATQRWLKGLNKSDADYEHHVLEGLWVHQHHNRPNLELLERVLTSPNPKARAAAVRVLNAWREQLRSGEQTPTSESAIAASRDASRQTALSLLLRAAADDDSRVRLMAIWASSFLPMAEAAEVVLVAAERPADPYIEFLSKEVMRTLQPLLDRAKAEGRSVAFSTEAGARHALQNMPTPQLLAQPRTKAVCLEILYRPGLQDSQRREAVSVLANLDKKPELQVVMEAIQNLDAKQQNADTTVVFDLVRQLTSRSAEELASARSELSKLAVEAKQPIFRQIGYASLVGVDGNIDAAWKLATTSADRLADFVNAMPIISDASVRATLYDRVEPLLNELPPELSAPKDRGTVGRFVRIELPGNGTLTLAEVEVFSGGENVARKGRASQKNTSHGGDAGKAIDGGNGGLFAMNTQTHTEENTGRPWWEVDLGEEFPIERIVVWNRTDGDLGKRLDNFAIRVLDKGRVEVWKQERNAAPRRNAQFRLEGGGKQDLVRRAAMNALTHVRGQEARTFSALSRFVKQDIDRVPAIRALQRLPVATWPKEQAPELVSVLLDGLRKTPAADRTSTAALAQFEFTDALLALLPADQGKATRAELRELGVRVIRIGTIFEKMAFDKDLVVVQAGKPVEFYLENTDLMPHNFVITQPGALEEIGMLSESQAQQPGFAERHYVPDSPKVLAKSALLQPRESQRVSFNAPQVAGVYPYVCTYPGHWRRMYGALYVVENLDDYLANPESYLATHKVEAVDPLLKDRRPRTEWKLEDLAEAVMHMEHDAGRNYGNGRQIFTAANCVACHRIDKENIGNPFGPELTKLDPKLQPIDILKEILDPSAKIEDKYKSNTIETGEGRVLTGLIVKETPDAIELVENPLASVKPIVLKRGDIVERVRSNTSIMPKGLLDKLTRDEILDLIAFVASRGNKQHDFFKSGHEH